MVFNTKLIFYLTHFRPFGQKSGKQINGFWKNWGHYNALSRFSDLYYIDFLGNCKENLPPPWTHGIGTANESPIRQIVKTKKNLKFIFVGDCCHVWNQNWTEDKPKNSLWFKVSPSLSNDVRIQNFFLHSSKFILKFL